MDKEVLLTDSMEDYLEAISVLGEKTKYVRVRDIAKEMCVRMPSVTEALKTLAEKDLVRHEKYEYVELTERGTAIALEIRHRHNALLEFLTEVLGVDSETASADACGIEHSVSPITLDRLSKLVKCIESMPEFLKRFRQYIEHSERPVSK